eukprot:7379904-Prymnesium_polylepis.2
MKNDHHQIQCVKAAQLCFELSSRVRGPQAGMPLCLRRFRKHGVRDGGRTPPFSLRAAGAALTGPQHVLVAVPRREADVEERVDDDVLWVDL